MSFLIRLMLVNLALSIAFLTFACTDKVREIENNLKKEKQKCTETVSLSIAKLEKEMQESLIRLEEECEKTKSELVRDYEQRIEQERQRLSTMRMPVSPTAPAEVSEKSGVKKLFNELE